MGRRVFARGEMFVDWFKQENEAKAIEAVLGIEIDVFHSKSSRVTLVPSLSYREDELSYSYRFAGGLRFQ